MMSPVTSSPEPVRRSGAAQARAIRDVRADWLRWSRGERLTAAALIALPPALSFLLIALAGG